MEYDGQELLEELLALRSSSWETNIPLDFSTDPYNYNTTTTNINNNGDDFNCLNPYFIPQLSSYEQISFPFDQPSINFPFTDAYTDVNESSTNAKLETSVFPTQEELEEVGLVMGSGNEFVGSTGLLGPCKPEREMPVCVSMERKNKSKKVDGQPSKNLMAERRRRKRLNERLSMLRSVVPKISKMDRTSILGDTIDYMKELLERINNVQEDVEVSKPSQTNSMSILKNVKPDEILARNTPKFDVERRDMDTRVDVCCTTKPGLLLSTMTTLEALGLEIQHCVISCFNDFAMQASCSEALEQRNNVSSEDIKQALFRNAGYGGRCV